MKYTVIHNVYVGSGKYVCKSERLVKNEGESLKEMLLEAGIDDPQFIFIGHPEVEGDNWSKIHEDRVRHLWKCPDCEDEVYVGPDFYADSGEPHCCACECDYEYVHTEINNG